MILNFLDEHKKIVVAVCLAILAYLVVAGVVKNKTGGAAAHNDPSVTESQTENETKKVKEKDKEKEKAKEEETNANVSTNAEEKKRDSKYK
jgi:mannitol-specific phosphotransferase system IIBC component